MAGLTPRTNGQPLSGLEGKYPYRLGGSSPLFLLFSLFLRYAFVEPKVESLFIDKGEQREKDETALGYRAGGQMPRLLLARDLILDAYSRLDTPWAGVSILDVGCGFADLAGLLPAGADYCGLEPIRAFADEARLRHSGAEIHTCSLEEYTKATSRRFDFVVGVGVLACLSEAELPSFSEAIARVAGGKVILSYLQPDGYTGFFNTISMMEFTLLFGEGTHYPERDNQVTAVL